MPVRRQDILALEARIKAVEKAARAQVLAARNGLDARLFPAGRLYSDGSSVAASTIGLKSFTGNTTPIFNGSEWKNYEITGGILPETITLTLDTNAAHTNYHQDDKNFDVFAVRDDSVGLTRLVTGPKWNDGAVAGSDTARGDGAGSTWIELFDGLVVNSYEMVCRYGNGANDLITVPPRCATHLGTIRTPVYEFDQVRFLWNRYNRIRQRLLVINTTASWNYSTNTWRFVENSSSMFVKVVVGDIGTGLGGGVDETETNLIELTAIHHASNSTATARNCGTGIGVDSTTVNSANIEMGSAVGSNRTALMARYIAPPPSIGFHAFNWLESAGVSDTQTWYGTASYAQSGMSGTLWC